MNTRIPGWCKTILITHLLLMALPAHGDDRQDLRIAIVGAGAAGLTAALTLTDMGYKRVTVFEAESQVGGKVSSVTVDNRIYEMGAIFVTPDYRTILNLADRFHVPYHDSGMRNLIHDDGTLYDAEDYAVQKFGLLRATAAMARFNLYKFLHPTATGDDFSRAPRGMNTNFASFSRQHGFEVMAVAAAPVFVGFGYGYFDEVPALYLMQLMESFAPLIFRATMAPGLLEMPSLAAVFPDGYQSLWKELARHLDVRLNSPVTRVVRSRTYRGTTRILVTAGQTTAEFDRLVISSPLDKALEFLDASPDERDLFSRIRYYAYTVTLFKGRNIPSPTNIFLADHATRASIDHVAGIYNRYGDRDVWTAGQQSSWSTSREALAETLKRDIGKLNGKVDAIVTQRTWPYFPHVTTADLDAGFYQRLDRLQGVNGTSYIGGIMNFETVEHTARFARQLMHRQF